MSFINLPKYINIIIMWPGIDPLLVAPDKLNDATRRYAARILFEVCIARNSFHVYRFAFSIKIMDIIKAKKRIGRRHIIFIMKIIDCALSIYFSCVYASKISLYMREIQSSQALYDIVGQQFGIFETLKTILLLCYV